MTKLLDNRDEPAASPDTLAAGRLVGSETPPLPAAVHSRADNVFDVLAQRASERSHAELWMTALGGSVNATFVWWQHPSLHWLGAGFMSVAAYGIWGLANHAISARGSRPRDLGTGALVIVRRLAVPAGVVSALFALGSFMAGALGGWIH